MGWKLNIEDSNSRSSRKWLSFVVAMWLMVCVSTQDTFPIYSPALKNVVNYDQFQLVLLSGAKETGRGFGFVAGILSFLVPIWVLLAVSIFESIISFGFLWLVLSERIAPPPFTLMYVMMWIAGNSITWMSTAALVVSIQNFPFNRGTVVGILKGIQALSAIIYVQIGTILFQNNVESLLLLLALLPASSNLVGVAFLWRVPPVMSRKETHDDRITFSWIYGSTMVLAVYMLTFNITSTLTTVSQTISDLYLVVLVLVLAVAIVVPIRPILYSCFDRFSRRTSSLSSDDQIEDPLLLREAEESAPLVADTYNHESEWMYAVTQANQSGEMPIEKKPIEQQSSSESAGNSTTSAPGSSRSSNDIEPEDQPRSGKNPAKKPQKELKKLGTHHFTVKDAWGAKEFWLLFFSLFCAIGMSHTLHENLSQVGAALGYNDVSVFVTIFSVSTFFGRVLGGGISEFLIKLAAIPRPFFAAIAEAIMVICYIQLALAFPAALYFGTFFAGFTSGVQMTIGIATASELFGLKFIGMLYNFLLLVYTLAKFFSEVLVSELYEYEAHKVGATVHPGSTMTVLAKWAEHHRLPILDVSYEKEPTCVGTHCFRWIFLIMAAVSALGVGLNVGLLLRVRRLYRSWYWNDAIAARAEHVPAAPLLISHT